MTGVEVFQEGLLRQTGFDLSICYRPTNSRLAITKLSKLNSLTTTVSPMVPSELNDWYRLRREARLGEGYLDVAHKRLLNGMGCLSPSGNTPPTLV